VLVPEECCGDAAEGPHRANLTDVGRRYADVTSSAEVLAYLDGLPRAA
jgi:maleamate amidohydrolase